ncbi:MAG: hypothetical protein BGO01_01615 [Armatimonadetes bacterium 55-13]|nr:GNAT family N-acetyltransferase [Armatimonadota bacterium]OJU65641.1 MAG: hypothetical protein BGO01_01615 [Armatimonadetes bacterium 55-13]
MVTIRGYRDKDAPALCGAWNAVWPHIARTPGELAREAKELEPQYQSRFEVAEIEGTFVGFSECVRNIGSYHPQKWTINIIVVPEHRRKGFGAHLYDAALTWLTPQDPIRLTTNIFEDDADANAFCLNRGFTERKRDFESELELDTFDPVILDQVASRPLPQGVTIKPLAEIDSPEIRRAFHEIFEEVRKDTPRAEPPTPLAFELFDQQVLGDPDFLKEGTMLALDASGRLIAFTGVFASPFEGSVEQWLTGCRREHRGQGIPTALKAAGIRWALNIGMKKILTDNDSRNAPMLAINDRFGFKRKTAFLTMVRDLVEI